MVGLAVPARAPNCGWPCAAKPRRTSTVRRNTRWSGRLVNCCANGSHLHIAKACYKHPYLMWPNNQCSLHTSSGRDDSLASFASRRARGLNGLILVGRAPINSNGPLFEGSPPASEIKTGAQAREIAEQLHGGTQRSPEATSSVHDDDLRPPEVRLSGIVIEPDRRIVIFALRKGR